jgi:hypothetical protein
MTPSPGSPLLPDISQHEVDFVIPRAAIDLPIGIDPFLLFKSRDKSLEALHTAILGAFNHGVALVRDGQIQDARALFDFPEVYEIGFGYTRKGRHGSGVGPYLGDLIVETLVDSPVLIERGIRHIEEMQLVSLGIGPDRLSDIAANLLKRYLVDYTQRQCDLWEIDRVSAPVEHVFDLETNTWSDVYEDLPTSPVDGSPMLFVPRRIVRTLPWINYQDFFRSEFSAYLRAKRVRSQGRGPARDLVGADKASIVAVTRREVQRIDNYVGTKEITAAEAQPSGSYGAGEGICEEAANLKERIAELLPGQADASKYHRTVLEVLNFLFNPELIDGKLEVRTVDGTERRDIVFTNDSDKTFWDYVRSEHSSIFLMFETKNTASLINTYFNQTATYLGDRLGRLGIIVTRRPVEESQQRKAFSIYNDSHPRKVILVISDVDLYRMLDMKCAGNDPMRFIQNRYRAFRTEVQ